MERSNLYVDLDLLWKPMNGGLGGTLVEKNLPFLLQLLLATSKARIRSFNWFYRRKVSYDVFGGAVGASHLKACHLDQLLVKIRPKVASWKPSLLSQAGHLILLQHVFSSMSSHLMVVLEVPKSVVKN